MENTTTQEPLEVNNEMAEPFDEIEMLAAIEGIKRGLASMRAGKSKPMKEAFEQLRKELGLPSHQTDLPE